MVEKKTKIDKSGKDTKVSRRKALSMMATTTGALVGVSFLHSVWGLETLEKVGETQTLTTKTSDGAIIHALAEPKRLVFTVEGKISLEQPIPLFALPKEKQEQQEEAVLQLLAASGSFVAPGSIQLKEKGSEGRIRVLFKFMGEEHWARRIKVTIDFKDATGNSLEGMACECLDRRIAAKQIWEGPLGIPMQLFPINIEVFHFDWELLNRIGQIVVAFEEL